MLKPKDFKVGDIAYVDLQNCYSPSKPNTVSSVTSICVKEKYKGITYRFESVDSPNRIKEVNDPFYIAYMYKSEHDVYEEYIRRDIANTLNNTDFSSCSYDTLNTILRMIIKENIERNTDNE